MEHTQRFYDETKDVSILKLLPVKAPVCPTCKLCLASESDLKVHEKDKHKKEMTFTPDQVENLKVVSQARNLILSPTINKTEGRILQTLPASNVGLIQVAKEDNQYINVLFDLNRLEMRNKSSTLADTVLPGYHVYLTAVQIEPSDPGFSENIPYYASAVTIGNEDDHDDWPRPFSTLKTELGSTLSEAQRVCKAALAVQLDRFSKGTPTPLFHTFPEQIEAGAGIVVMKNQSVLLVKLQQENCFALQILESILLTKRGSDSSGEETFEIGESIEVNALMMDPQNPTQYLITGSWSLAKPRSPIARSSLSLAVVDMFHSLAVAYCRDPPPPPVIDLSNVIVPMSDGFGFDDIAADITDIGEGGIADSDIVGDDISSNSIGAEDSSDIIPFKRIKLSSFAKSE